MVVEHLEHRKVVEHRILDYIQVVQDKLVVDFHILVMKIHMIDHTYLGHVGHVGHVDHDDVHVDDEDHEDHVVVLAHIHIHILLVEDHIHLAVHIEEAVVHIEVVVDHNNLDLDNSFYIK